MYRTESKSGRFEDLEPNRQSALQGGESRIYLVMRVQVELRLLFKTLGVRPGPTQGVGGEGGPG